MVSVPSDFTDSLLVDDRFRSERRAAARRGAANYKNLEALAQKFWKSQDPRMPDVHHKRSVLKPINPILSDHGTSVRDSTNTNDSSTDHASGRGTYKPKVRFVGVSSPSTTIVSDCRTTRIGTIHSDDQVDDISLPRKTTGTLNVAGNSTTRVSAVKIPQLQGPIVTYKSDQDRSQYQEQTSQIKDKLDSQSSVSGVNTELRGLEKKRMRTYQKRITHSHDDDIPEENENTTSRSSISELSELISPRTFCNQRRRKINMQFTSNNGQVTVIQTSGKGARHTGPKEDNTKRDDKCDPVERELVDDIDKDSLRLKRENTVAVLKRIDVILHGPDKPPVASELGSSVKEVWLSDSVDFTESEVDLPFFGSEEDIDDHVLPPNYEEPLVALDSHTRKPSHGDHESCATLEEILDNPQLRTKLDVYVKCQEWLDRWF